MAEPDTPASPLSSMSDSEVDLQSGLADVSLSPRSSQESHASERSAPLSTERSARETGSQESLTSEAPSKQAGPSGDVAEESQNSPLPSPTSPPPAVNSLSTSDVDQGDIAEPGGQPASGSRAGSRDTSPAPVLSEVDHDTEVEASFTHTPDEPDTPVELDDKVPRISSPRPDAQDDGGQDEDRSALAENPTLDTTRVQEEDVSPPSPAPRDASRESSPRASVSLEDQDGGDIAQLEAPPSPISKAVDEVASLAVPAVHEPTEPAATIDPAPELDLDAHTPSLAPSATPSQDVATAPPPVSLSRSPSRQLTPSRSPSPAPSADPRLSDANGAGPSRRQSAASDISRSPVRTPSPGYRSLSPTGFTSPRPAPFYLPKPTLPSSKPVILDETEAVEVDQSAPFESIPLATTPYPHSATLPSSPSLHPGSPEMSRKRRSWNGSAVSTTKDSRASQDGVNGHMKPADGASRSSISVLRHSNHSHGNQAAPEQTEGEEGRPRLHAPPAHPHPYPVPTPGSPPPVTDTATKRLSQSPVASTSTSAAVPAALGVKGSSTFEKVISHTRPSWLPPKDRVEDETHYHQWEEMMAQARKAEQEKRKLDEARRIEKEKKLAINTPKWEEMLDEKTFSADKIRRDPALRRIWFEGAPTYLRGKAWSLAIGNPLALSKDTYKSCVARSKKAIDSGRFPPDILDRLEVDLDSTLVHLRLFQKSSPLRADLHELVCAWVVYRSDTAMGYAPYITYLAALFLLSSPPATAFLSLINLLSRPVMRAFYTETQDEIDAFYRVFENLQADMFPKIFANCKNLGLKVPESWFRSLLVEQVPFEAACRLWDQIMLDGDGYIFRSALAIFGFLEPRLHFPDRDEIGSVLEGRNRATAAILEREKERAKLRGETYQEELDGKLSVFGLNEQALFDWLKEDGWREARFERLVTREMPD